MEEALCTLSIEVGQAVSANISYPAPVEIHLLFGENLLTFGGTFDEHSS